MLVFSQGFDAKKRIEVTSKRAEQKTAQFMNAQTQNLLLSKKRMSKPSWMGLLVLLFVFPRQWGINKMRWKALHPCSRASSVFVSFTLIARKCFSPSNIFSSNIPTKVWSSTPCFRTRHRRWENEATKTETESPHYIPHVSTRKTTRGTPSPSLPQGFTRAECALWHLPYWTHLTFQTLEWSRGVPVNIEHLLLACPV